MSIGVRRSEAETGHCRTSTAPLDISSLRYPTAISVFRTLGTRLPRNASPKIPFASSASTDFVIPYEGMISAAFARTGTSEIKTAARTSSDIASAHGSETRLVHSRSLCNWAFMRAPYVCGHVTVVLSGHVARIEGFGVRPARSGRGKGGETVGSGRASPAEGFIKARATGVPRHRDRS